MKDVVKGGLIGALFVLIIYLFSIFSAILRLEQTSIVYSLVVFFMHLLKVYNFISRSVISILLFISYFFTLIVFFIKKNMKFKEFLIYFSSIALGIIILTYVLPKTLLIFNLHPIANLLWYGKIRSLLPLSLCCPPSHLQGPIGGWIIALIVDMIVYSAVGAYLYWVMVNVKIKK